MQNKKLFILAFYALPYAYMAMAIDIIKGSVLSYMLMILMMSALMLLSVRTSNIKTAFLGNLISLGISCFLSVRFPINEISWSGFFKPFSPQGMIIFLHAAAFIIQLIILIVQKKKAAQ